MACHVTLTVQDAALAKTGKGDTAEDPSLPSVHSSSWKRYVYTHCALGLERMYLIFMLTYTHMHIHNMYTQL